MMKLVRLFLIWVLLAFNATPVNAQEEELLEPDLAFALNVEAVDANRVAVTWTIADGYYMYRDKFKFQALDGGTISAVDYPKGKIKSDEFFGDVEVYLHEARFDVELSEPAGEIKLALEGQGCNEPVGVCYPPILKEIVLSLPVAEAQAATDEGTAPLSTPAAGNDAVDELRNLLGDLGGDDEFLHVDDAFGLDLDATDGSRLSARYEVADGYYLYQDKISFKVVSGSARAGEPDLPPGKEKEDEYFGLMTVYLEDFEVNVPLIRSAPGAEQIVVEAGYQGCAEKGICYPPVTRQFTLDLPSLVPAAQAQSDTTPTAAAASASNDPAVGAPPALPGKSFLGYLLSAFGIGVLLTFTPCVLPMIPILSSIIVGQGQNMTRAKGGLLSFIYVIGTAVTYAVIGWVAGATGDQLQAYFQNIWAIGVLSLIFVLMALSMFGLYKIQMPSFIQSRIQQKSSTIQGGTVGMVFVLGLMSALIVGACVSPLLISLLTIAITEGDPVLGASMMVAMAMGMGVFLVAIGFGAGSLLPRAGAWMERVNYVFGVLLIAVAIYLLTAVPAVPVLLLWAALLIIVGVYMGATQALPEGASGWRYLNKGIGTIALIWGTLALLGGLAGNRDIMNPIPAGTFGFSQSPGGGEAHEEPLFVRVSNLDELEAQFVAARSSGRHLMLDFYADWCTDCIRMEKTTFVDAEVKRKFDSDFVLAQVDVTDPNHEGGKAIKQHFGVYGPPAILFFRDGGEEIRDLRLYGYRGKDEFLAILNDI